MKRIIAYMAIPAMILAGCNKPLELAEVEESFAPKGNLPTVTIDPASVVIDQYEQEVTVDVTFSGVSAGMKNLELGLLSATDPGFVSSSSVLVETPEDGTYTLTVRAAAGVTNYIKAMAASDDGAVYSDRVTVDVPDIPWYYKAKNNGQYVGTFTSETDGSGTAYENHVITIEFSDDFSTMTIYEMDPWIKANVEGYNAKTMNYATGDVDLTNRTVTFNVASNGVDVNAGSYLLGAIAEVSDQGVSLDRTFVVTFNEDATEISYPWYGVLDTSGNTLKEIYDAGITLNAN